MQFRTDTRRALEENVNYVPEDPNISILFPYFEIQIPHLEVQVHCFEIQSQVLKFKIP